MSYRIHKFDSSPKRLSAVVASIKQIVCSPIKNFVIILIISSAVFLALVSYLLWKNVDTIYENWNESVEISVYLKKKIDIKKVDILVKELKESSVTARLELIKPDDGMKVFMETTSLTALLSSFKDNPLPNVIVIYPRVKKVSKDKVFAFINMLKNRAEVDIVKADIDWIEHSSDWLGLLDKLVRFLVFILSINALLIVCGVSFIVSQILSNKDRISKIVLQYQFMWLSLIGSLFALLFIRIVLLILQDNNIFLDGLRVGTMIFLVLISSLLGLISSRLATVSR